MSNLHRCHVSSAIFIPKSDFGRCIFLANHQKLVSGQPSWLHWWNHLTSATCIDTEIAALLAVLGYSQPSSIDLWRRISAIDRRMVESAIEDRKLVIIFHGNVSRCYWRQISSIFLLIRRRPPTIHHKLRHFSASAHPKPEEEYWCREQCTMSKIPPILSPKWLVTRYLTICFRMSTALKKFFGVSTLLVGLLDGWVR